MAKSSAPLASDRSGPNCINQKGREEHSFPCGTNGDKVQDSDIRVPEQPWEVGKTELDRQEEHGVAAKKVWERQFEQAHGNVRCVP